MYRNVKKNNNKNKKNRVMFTLHLGFTQSPQSCLSMISLSSGKAMFAASQ